MPGTKPHDSKNSQKTRTSVGAMVPGATKQASAGSVRGASTFAMIVAINRYKKKEIPPLEGCIADGDDFNKFLEEDLGVPARNIRKLYNENATRSNILSTFRTHLIDNANIEHDNLIFFFYAGHGGRMKAPPEWKCEDDQMESICTYDETVESHAGSSSHASAGQDAARALPKVTAKQMIPGIPDHTFAQLMCQLAEKRGDNIVAIFDCCHSGGMARGRGVSASAILVPRTLGDTLRRPPPPVEEWTAWRDCHLRNTATRRADMEVPRGFAYSTLKSHVLLAACQPEQVAYEHRPLSRSPSGRSTACGLFTFHLLSHLRSVIRQSKSPRSDPMITYAALIRGLHDHEPRLIESDEPGPLDKQHPLCEGANRDRYVFSTITATNSNTFTLDYSRGALRVKAGSLSGFSMQTKLMCYRRADPKGRVHLRVVKVDPFWTTVDLEKPQPSTTTAGATNFRLDKLQGLEAIVTAWTSHSQSLKISLNGLDVVPKDGVLFPVVLVKDPAQADISFSRCSGKPRKIEIKRRDPLIARKKHMSTIMANTCITDNIDLLLQKVAKFNFHLYRTDGMLPHEANLLPVDVHMYRLEIVEGTLKTLLAPVAGGEDFLGEGRATERSIAAGGTFGLGIGKLTVKETIVTDLSSRYGLTLINKSSYDLFAYVFYFDPIDYSIAQWHLPTNENKAPLKKAAEKGYLEIGYGGGANEAIEFSLRRKGVKRESGFLKIFVSTSYVDMSNFAETGYDFETGEVARGASMTKVPTKGGWSASTYVLTCVAPSR